MKVRLRRPAVAFAATRRAAQPLAAGASDAGRQDVRERGASTRVGRAGWLPLLAAAAGLVLGVMQHGCATTPGFQVQARMVPSGAPANVAFCPVVVGMQAQTAEGPLFAGPGISQHTGVVGGFLVRAHGRFFLVDGGLPGVDVMPFPFRVLDGNPAYVLPAHVALPAQLAQAGISAARVSFLVLTHAHGDHGGVAESFPGLPLLLTDSEASWVFRMFPVDRDVRTWRTGAAWDVIRPRLRAVTPRQPWEGTPLLSMDLFGDGSVVLVHTPGHTPGSMSVLLATQPHPTLLVGDAAVTEKSVRDNIPTGILNKGIDSDPPGAERTLAQLSGVLQRNPQWAVFTAHDEQLLRHRYTFQDCAARLLGGPPM